MILQRESPLGCQEERETDLETEKRRWKQGLGLGVENQGERVGAVVDRIAGG